eukprot:CAMPEP_0197014150 /NCGR_PEP_ID=MMETSP1380-20130617/69052_1 /TAXON_ID=5936 /ORGANISM="Euplotes crassus, Strain CT5" /LENGTH=111 /DNA_ID=CAMNT_0042438923 /DNA_START=76 /DNA_END=408 /DNA_ORIENTATION=-
MYPEDSFDGVVFYPKEIKICIYDDENYYLFKQAWSQPLRPKERFPDYSDEEDEEIIRRMNAELNPEGFGTLDYDTDSDIGDDSELSDEENPHKAENWKPIYKDKPPPSDSD